MFGAALDIALSASALIMLLFNSWAYSSFEYDAEKHKASETTSAAINTDATIAVPYKLVQSPHAYMHESENLAS